MLVAMTAHTTSPRPSPRLSALMHRWPSAVGFLAAVGAFLAGVDRVSVALVVAIAATCYVAAAAFSLPWMAWAWIPLSFVVVFAGALVELDPLVGTAGAAAVLVVIGLLVALTLVAHGVWDLWHLRRHRDLVSPSLAEACVALDVPLGLAVLVAVVV
jgi:hypothetical protein